MGGLRWFALLPGTMRGIKERKVRRDRWPSKVLAGCRFMERVLTLMHGRGEEGHLAGRQS